MPVSPSSVAGYFAVVVHEAAMDALGIPDPNTKYYCTLDAVNEGGGVNFPFSTGPSPAPHLSWRSETLG